MKQPMDLFHVRFTEEQRKILELTKERDPKIKSIAEAIRLRIENPLPEEIEDNDPKIKMQKMEKEINRLKKDMSILIEMVAGIGEFLGAKEIPVSEGTDIYNASKRVVESKIQSSVTKKSNKYSSKIEITEPTQKINKPKNNFDLNL